MLAVGLIALVVVVAGVEGAASDTAAASASSGGVPGAFPGATGDETLARAGEPVTTGGLVLSSSPVKAGNSVLGKTLCTSVSYRNGTAGTVPFDGFDWTLQDPDGRVRSPTFGGSGATLSSGELAPGETVAGVVCFEDRGGAAGRYAVLYQGPTAPGERIAWLHTR